MLDRIEDREKLREYWRLQKRKRYHANSEVMKTYLREYRKKHPEKARAYVRKSYQNAKKKVFELLDNKCSSCGNKDFRCLQIDHINGNGSQDRKGHVGSMIYFYIRKQILAGSREYQILCANCNWIKRYEKKEHVRRID